MATDQTLPTAPLPRSCSFTVNDVMLRLNLNQTTAYQLIGAFRELGLFERGDKVREEGATTGSLKQSYVLPLDALSRAEVVLEKLRKVPKK